MARVIGKSVTDGSSIFIEWQPRLPNAIELLVEDSTIELHSGHIERDVAKTLAGTVLLITPPVSGGVPEVMGKSVGPYFFCEALKNWMEDHDAHGIKFHKIRVVSTTPIKGQTEHGYWYVVGDIPILEPLDVKKTIWAGGMHGRPDGRTLSMLPDAACVAFKSAIEGHHFWKTSHRQGLRLMCSEEFWLFYKSSGFRGFDCVKICEET